MAPQFTMRPRDRRVQVTFPVRLTCQVIGFPKPDVTWYHNHNPIIIGDDGKIQFSSFENIRKTQKTNFDLSFFIFLCVFWVPSQIVTATAWTAISTRWRSPLPNSTTPASTASKAVILRYTQVVHYIISPRDFCSEMMGGAGLSLCSSFDLKTGITLPMIQNDDIESSAITPARITPVRL